MATCPFCGSPETDRIVMDGERFLVFRCMFTPRVGLYVPDSELDRYLRDHFGADGTGYFRGMCDRLHLFVTKGAGGQLLTAPPEKGSGSSPSL
ncbi:MAG: hypothetical protein WCA77_06730 [Thermoplasmata archaeon]